ncbi:MAG: hypothetical protein Crog4KO_13570 [Crocinitomicaceae bacterium]
MKKEEFALESFKNIQELIRFIDQKSGAVLVIAGLAFTGYIEFVDELQFVPIDEAGFLGVTCFLSGLCTVLCLIAVIWISIFKVLKPRLAKNYSAGEHSLFYFEHLSKLGKASTLAEYGSLTDDKMLKQLIDQQFEISQIMEKKTENLGLSFNFLFASIIALVVFVLTSIVL